MGVNQTKILVVVVVFLNGISSLPMASMKGTVSGSGTGPLDYGATGPVPDP